MGMGYCSLLEAGLTAAGRVSWRRNISGLTLIRKNGIDDDTNLLPIGPLQDPITWYGINYAETQVTQWDFRNLSLIHI